MAYQEQTAGEAEAQPVEAAEDAAAAEPAADLAAGAAAAEPERAGFDAASGPLEGFQHGDAARVCSPDVPTCVEQYLSCAPGDEACRAAALAGGPLEPGSGGALDGVMRLYEAGGPIIAILAVLSLISLTIILAKVVQFILLDVSAKRFIADVGTLLKNGQDDRALRLLENKRGPVARVMESAVRGRKLGAKEETTREEVTRIAQGQLEGMEAGLPYLSLIATISPLLGLLGTVLGMIDAFQQLEGAGDRVDPAILSGGIWEALLTTAAGLSVAIPAAAFFTWLQRTVDVVAQRMEDAATRVFTVDLFNARAEPAGEAEG